MPFSQKLSGIVALSIAHPVVVEGGVHVKQQRPHLRLRRDMFGSFRQELCYVYDVVVCVRHTVYECVVTCMCVCIHVVASADSLWRHIEVSSHLLDVPSQQDEVLRCVSDNNLSGAPRPGLTTVSGKGGRSMFLR